MLKKLNKLVGLKKLTAIVEDSSTNQGRLFDLMIQSLIILSLVAFSIETLPDLNKGLLDYLDNFELICVIIFSVEYSDLIESSVVRLPGPAISGNASGNIDAVELVFPSSL